MSPLLRLARGGGRSYRPGLIPTQYSTVQYSTVLYLSTGVTSGVAQPGVLAPVYGEALVRRQWGVYAVVLLLTKLGGGTLGPWGVGGHRDTGTLPTWRMAICMKHSSGGDPICLLDTFIFGCFFSSFWTFRNHISFETILNQLLCSLPNNHNKMSTKGWSLGPIERKNPLKWRSWIERIKWKTHAKQGLNSNTCWMDKYNWGFSPPTKSLLIMMNGNITQKLFWCFDVDNI